ncbi:MAG: hypothetical protein CMJ89_04365 [Planctomycetes bacterium]|nr:hypothetical protein [Planctomycetota bacterium]
MQFDFERCCSAVLAHDARFDGPGSGTKVTVTAGIETNRIVGLETALGYFLYAGSVTRCACGVVRTMKALDDT